MDSYWWVAFNMFLAIAIAVVNVMYLFIRNGNLEKSLKMAYAFNALLVFLFYIEILRGSYVSTYLKRSMVTLLLATIMTESVVSFMKHKINSKIIGFIKHDKIGRLGNTNRIPGLVSDINSRIERISENKE